MFRAVILQFLLLISLSASADNITSLQIPNTANLITGPCQAIKVESESIREEAGRIRQEGYAAMEKAYKVKDEAYETLNSAFESRRELESLLVDMVTLMKTQTSTTSLYIQDMRNVLTGLAGKVEQLEESVSGVKQTVEDKTAELKQQGGNLADKLREDRALLEQEIGKVKMSLDEVGSELKSKIDVTTSLSSSIKSRQQVWMSEIRLISLYKSVDQNHPHPDYGNGVVTDGNFEYSEQPHGEKRNHCHTGPRWDSKIGDSKLWINLGGYFKIHQIFVWNLRYCCLEQLVGTHVYADEELIGTVVREAKYHEFLIPEEQPTYASTITLHQPLERNIHVLEVQVWGNGPFSEDDIFT